MMLRLASNRGRLMLVGVACCYLVLRAFACCCVLLRPAVIPRLLIIAPNEEDDLEDDVDEDTQAEKDEGKGRAGTRRHNEEIYRG